MKTYRSPAKLFAFGLVGLILIVAAVDVMFGHWLSEAPEMTDGSLTTRGQAQLRGDLLWGSVMVATGVLLVGGAVVELVRRKPQALVSNSGLTLAIGSHEHDVEIPWEAIGSVSSDTAMDPFDGAERRYLLVELTDRGAVPDDLIGAVWEGDVLRVDADDWTKQVTDVALSAQGSLAHHRRMNELKDMGPPELVWDIDVTDADTAPTAEVKSSAVVVDDPPGEPVVPSTEAVDAEASVDSADAGEPPSVDDAQEEDRA